MKSESLSDLLAKTPWVRSLPTPVRERVIADAYETHHDARQVVARKGDLAQSWMGVAEGLIKASSVVRSGKVVMFSGLPPGAWFGEGSVIRRTIRQYDLVAVRRSRVMHIPRATFRWLLDIDIDFNHYIIDHLNARLGQFMAMTETDRMTDPVVRVARAISGLFDPVLHPGLGPLLQISQEELGELAGISRQSANAAVKALQAAGLVRAAYGGLLIMELDALRNLRET
jgi:CRP/FNR family transcriptional regulator, cyclic AMP receptor protein